MKRETKNLLALILIAILIMLLGDSASDNPEVKNIINHTKNK